MNPQIKRKCPDCGKLVFPLAIPADREFHLCEDCRIQRIEGRTMSHYTWENISSFAEDAYEYWDFSIYPNPELAKETVKAYADDADWIRERVEDIRERAIDKSAEWAYSQLIAEFEDRIKEELGGIEG